MGFRRDGIYGDPFIWNDINPTKVFMAIGVYNVSLEVTDASAATDTIDVP
jgi:hypothetical protein